MRKTDQADLRPLFLGIEGGGSHTVAILADARGRSVGRMEEGPANLRLLSDAELRRLLGDIAAELPGAEAVGIGMAGARSEEDLERIRKVTVKIWPGIPCVATNDLETALAADEESKGARDGVHVLVLSGTGSCCYGRKADGRTARTGGWGHILGDRGSGFEIGLRALKEVVLRFDHSGEWSRLGRQILQRLQLNEPGELIAWAQGAEKNKIASLAEEVFAAGKKGDRIAKEILAGAARSLAEEALVCAGKLAGSKDARVHFTLAGSVLLKQPGFGREMGKRLRRGCARAEVAPLSRESAWGAVALARRAWEASAGISTGEKMQRVAGTLEMSGFFPSGKMPPSTAGETPAATGALARFGRSSPTEQRNGLSRGLDKMPVARAIKLMLSEDGKIPGAILAEAKKIERAVGFIAQAFKRGGRLFYVGAGTSGRLGVLDASECPPTFRTAPELVQGIIAGGQGALWRSVEGAEDDAAAGGRAMEFRGVNGRDVVVGITASGRTPFVWGALGEAKARGAKTVLVAFNPFVEIARASRPTLIITPNVGPEILTGSTRLKAGTATKLVLNIFTTLAMVRSGKVVSNLMSDLNASNAKLRDRAVRIVQELGGVDYATAEEALRRSNWVVKKARGQLRRQISNARQRRRA